MKSLSTVFLTLSLCLAGCSASKLTDQNGQIAASTQQAKVETDRSVAKESSKSDAYHPTQLEQTVSLESAVDRKIIRDANLTIEVNSTTQAQQQVTSIAESNGGFVVTSEAKQRENADPARRSVD